MNKFIATVATLLLAGTSGTAMAQDAAPFGGFYAGAITGYDHVVLSGFGGSAKKDGLVFGAVAGYDANLGSALVGADAEISGSTAKQRATNIAVAGDSGSLKAGRDLYIGARVGFLATPATLVYAKGGYVNGRANVSYTSGATTTEAGSSVDGLRVGAGIEQAVSAFRVRLEYRYSDYKQFSYAGTALGVDAKRHQVLVGLLGRF